MGRFRRLKDKPPYLAFPSLNHLENRCSATEVTVQRLDDNQQFKIKPLPK
jgi:hypothetical protein